MSSVKASLIANYCGKIAGMLLIAISTPIYIRHLGLPAYGLVGVSLTFQSLVTLFDFGLSATLTRELARRTASPQQAQELSDVIHRLELIYWIFAAFVGILLWFAVTWVSQHWLQATEVDTTVVIRSLRFASLAVAAQLPVGFYAAGLVGLQRHVLNNVMYVASVCLRVMGGAFVAASTGDIVAFFLWQFGASVLSALAYATVLRLCAPEQAPQPQFTTSRSADTWTFSIGMSGITIGMLCFNQVDKILMSRTLLLEQFGFYTLAATVVGSLSLLYQPVVATFGPKLAQAVARDDYSSLASLYHASAQLIAVTAIPAAVVASLFSYELLLAWTVNSHVAMATSRLVQAMMPGALLGALTYVPHTLMRAAGWTLMPFTVIIGTLLLLVPALLLVGGAGGGTLAATAWSGLVLIQSVILVSLMHTRLLPDERRQWFLRDVATPLVAIVMTGVVVRILFKPAESIIEAVQSLATAAIAASVAAVVATPLTRHILIRNGLLAMNALTATAVR